MRTDAAQSRSALRVPAAIIAMLLCLLALWCVLSPLPRHWPPLGAISPAWLAMAAVGLFLAGVFLLSAGAGPTEGGGRWLAVITIVAMSLFPVAVLALFLADLFYIQVQEIFDALGSAPILAAMRLSALTSLAALGIIMLVAIPVGYALSRYRFPLSVLADSLVDLPMVAPPLIIGVSLLVFFQTPLGKWISGTGLEFVYTVKGIVLCQFFASSSYGIRAAKAAFDAVDTDLENLALTLGCSPLGAFRRVTLPLARNGLLAAGIIAWAHAVGLFAPLQVFAGAIRMKTEVMPTAIYLELSIGRIEKALAVSLIMLVMAGVALVALHWLAPGRRARK